MSMPFAIRVGSSPQDGGGHVRRCLNIARALRIYSEVIFILDDDGGEWGRPLSDEGFISIPTKDAAGTEFSGCLLDSYRLSETEKQFWRSVVPFLAVMHDEGLPWPKADLAISPSTDASVSKLDGVSAACGLGFAPLGSSFASAPQIVISEKAKKILVTFGLQDSVNATTWTVDSLMRLEEQNHWQTVTVVLGSRSPQIETLETKIRDHGAPYVLKTDVKNMSDLMVEHDMVIGGGGVSALERAALGLPSITLAIASNQVPVAAQLAEQGATNFLGMHDNVPDEELDREIAILAQSSARRRSQSEAGKMAVDGCGADRIAQALILAVKQSKTEES